MMVTVLNRSGKPSPDASRSSEGIVDTGDTSYGSHEGLVDGMR